MRHHGDSQGALAVPPITEGESSLRLDRKVVTGGGLEEGCGNSSRLQPYSPWGQFNLGQAGENG